MEIYIYTYKGDVNSCDCITKYDGLRVILLLIYLHDGVREMGYYSSHRKPHPIQLHPEKVRILKYLQHILFLLFKCYRIEHGGREVGKSKHKKPFLPNCFDQ